MKHAKRILMAGAVFFCFQVDASELPKVGDTFQILSIEQLADQFELDYGDIESMTVGVEYPRSRDYPNFNAMFEGEVSVRDGLPDNISVQVEEAEAQAVTRQIEISIPVPEDQLVHRDGSLDRYLAALLSGPLSGATPEKNKEGRSTIQTNGGSCSFGGTSYPDGTVINQLTCGSTANVSYSIRCVNGTWIVESFQAEAAELCD